MTDLERENRRHQGELIRAHEEIADLKDRFGLRSPAGPRAECEGATERAALDLALMAPETCGQCADGWVWELHLDGTCVEECGVAMPCPHPACPLSWATETDPATGLVRPHESDERWRLASPVFRRSAG
jgi:hypothetical protein